jgi:hypothetical protein
MGSAWTLGLVTSPVPGVRIIQALIRRVLPAAGDDVTAVTRFVEAVCVEPLRPWACLGVHVGAWFATAAEIALGVESRRPTALRRHTPCGQIP